MRHPSPVDGNNHAFWNEIDPVYTLVDMISGMEVKEDDDDFMNAVDYMFAGLEKRKPDCFAVKQYKKYKLSSGDICSK